MPKIDLGLVKGPQGDTGPQGAVGPTGAQGIEGPAGKDATVNGYNATTLEVSGNLKLQQKDGAITIKTTPELDSAVQWHSNPNLLDNWYFVGGGSQLGDGHFPINQKGKTRYTELVLAYTIDRWVQQFYNATQSDMTIPTEGISFGKGSIILQLFNKGYIPNGATVTASFLYDNILSAGTVQWEGPYAWICGTELASINKLQESENGIQLYFNEDFSKHVLKAVKLEFGTEQTLAHKEGENWVLNEIPNYQQELAKCKNHQIVFKGMYQQIGNFFCLAAGRCTVICPVNALQKTPTITLSGTLRFIGPSVSAYLSGPINVQQINGLHNAIAFDVLNVEGVEAGNIGFVDLSDPDSYLILDANL